MTLRPNTINWLAAIIRKGHGKTDKETGREIDLGGEIWNIRNEYDYLTAENERYRKVVEAVQKLDLMYPERNDYRKFDALAEARAALNPEEKS